ncbi:MAG: SURF1 family cytochrome oxidase biogenesis protein, partial [Novosphingobium sp.]
SAAVPWPTGAADSDAALFRHSRVVCERVMARGAKAGRSAAGESGWAQTARCALDGGGEAEIVLGWSRAPAAPEWAGGEVHGVVAPGPRLVASPPLAGLAPIAHPDPRDIPNNHLAYAVQWFVFATAAAVIYALALRRRG